VPALTPAERRGTLLVAALLLLGAGYDLWRLGSHPMTPPLPRVPQSAADSGRAAGTPAETSAAGTGRRAGARIDLNRAGPTELDALPGIGPVLAGRIVAHRELHGPFRRAEDLLAVRGIGPRLLERLRDRIEVRPPP
jgi:competence protein ComEA